MAFEILVYFSKERLCLFSQVSRIFKVIMLFRTLIFRIPEFSKSCQALPFQYGAPLFSGYISHLDIKIKTLDCQFNKSLELIIEIKIKVSPCTTWNCTGLKNSFQSHTTLHSWRFRGVWKALSQMLCVWCSHKYKSWAEQVYRSLFNKCEASVKLPWSYEWFMVGVPVLRIILS